MFRSALSACWCATFLISLAPPVFGQTPAAPETRPAVEAASDSAEGTSGASLVSAGASATFTSAFVWRGFQLTDYPCLQPSAWVTVGPVTVTSWMSLDRPKQGPSDLTEHDLTIDYTREWRGLALSVGWTNYYFPGAEAGRHSNEAYGAVGLGGYLNPSVQVFHDWQEGHGTYVALSVRHEYGITPGAATVTPSLSLGYNRHQWSDVTGLSDVNAGLSLRMPIARRAVLRPFINYSIGLRGSGLPSVLYGGLTVELE